MGRIGRYLAIVGIYGVANLAMGGALAYVFGFLLTIVTGIIQGFSGLPLGKLYELDRQSAAFLSTLTAVASFGAAYALSERSPKSSAWLARFGLFAALIFITIVTVPRGVGR